jgi:hypothetical protein
MPYPARDNAFPPAFSTRFTSFASQLVLSGVGNSSPAGVKHLPCQVVVEVSTADTHLDYKDGSNVLVAMNFKVPGTYVIRMAPSSIETTTTVAAVTVFWQAVMA